MKMPAGAERAEAGEIRVEGKPVTIEIPRDAKALGIETTCQTLVLAENLDAPANVFLGRELTTPSGLLDEEAMEHESPPARVRGRAWAVTRA